MRVAVIADIHGNAPALEAVLDDIARAGVDAIVDCGDAASGPLPDEVLDLLGGLGDRLIAVAGNGDHEVVAAFEDPTWAPLAAPPDVVTTTRFVASRLSFAHHHALATRPRTVELDVEGLGRTVFCHGTPRSAAEVVTALSPPDRLADALAGVEAAVVVGGHTHMRLDRPAGRHRFVNPGSVGLPYEGAPGAYWALLGPAVEMRRTTYDLASAAGRLAASGMPRVHDQFLDVLRRPPAPDDVARSFEARLAAPRLA